jgi:hypothetical protein
MLTRREWTIVAVTVLVVLALLAISGDTFIATHLH